MFVFYLYINLSVAHEALIFAQNITQTPPVWTAEKGLSPAFIEKYEITPREREVTEAMLQGKTDKEIAVKLNIAVTRYRFILNASTGKQGRRDASPCPPWCGAGEKSP